MRQLSLDDGQRRGPSDDEEDDGQRRGASPPEEGSLSFQRGHGASSLASLSTNATRRSTSHHFRKTGWPAVPDPFNKQPVLLLVTPAVPRAPRDARRYENENSRGVPDLPGRGFAARDDDARRPRDRPQDVATNDASAPEHFYQQKAAPGLGCLVK